MSKQLKLESIALVFLISLLTGCGGGSDTPVQEERQPPPIPSINIEVGIKQISFRWNIIADIRWGATHFKLLENPDGHSGFTQVGDDIPYFDGGVRRDIAVHQFDFTNALYIIEACNLYLCSRTSEINVMGRGLDAIGYFKASNTRSDRLEDEEEGDRFGDDIGISDDGTVLAVVASRDSGIGVGIDGDQTHSPIDIDTASPEEENGAIYVFRNDGSAWSQEVYIKPPTRADRFIGSIALSGDGDSLFVAGLNASGFAIYQYRFDGTAWSFATVFPAPYSRDIEVSRDGTVLLVGARFEPNNSGAAYIYRFDGIDWSEEAYLTASNIVPGQLFGDAIAIAADGNTVAIGARGESSDAVGIGGDQQNDLAPFSGAVYVFSFDGQDWLQQAYIKSSNSNAGDQFGSGVDLNADGTVLAVGAPGESSASSGINSDGSNNDADQAGAAYLFEYDGQSWQEQTYFKPMIPDGNDHFGGAVALTDDGIVLAVGAPDEDSDATGVTEETVVKGVRDDDGAVYVFEFDGIAWNQRAFVKPKYLAQDFGFGGRLKLNRDGTSLAVASVHDSNGVTGINSDINLIGACGSYGCGAVYLY